MPPLSHLTSCTPTKFKLYLANSLAAAVSEPALYRLLTFRVPNLMSLFRCLRRTKVSVQVRGLLYECFVARYVITVRSCKHSPNPQDGGPPPVGCPRLLIQYIRSYRPYWRPLLHPLPEDAPYRGDRDPLISGIRLCVCVCVCVCVSVYIYIYIYICKLE